MRLLTCLFALLATATAAMAQPRSNAGYECEEEIFPRFDKATRTYGYVNMVGQWRVDPTFTKAQRFSGKLAVVQQGTKFGLLNCQGRLVTGTVFDEIQNFVNGRGWARQGSLWGLLDEKGKLVVPFAFEDIRPVGPRNELTWVKKKGVWGIFNKENIKMEVEPKYEACRSISDSLGLGMRGGYISPIYLGTAQVIYDSCTLFEKAGGNTFRFAYHNRQGLMEATGTVLLRPIYESMEVYKDYLLLKKDGKWAIASLLGAIETEFAFEEVRGANSVLAAAKKNGKWGYVLASGKPYIPFEYEDALTPVGQFYALKLSGTWAVNSQRESLKPADFKNKDVHAFGPGLIVQESDSIEYLLNPYTGQIWKDKFAQEVLEDDGHTLVYFYKGLAGAVDMANFNRYIPMQYQSVYGLKGPFCVIVKDKKKGLASLDSHKEIVTPIYERLDTIACKPDFFQGMVGGKVTLLNASGQSKGSIDGDKVWSWKQDTYVVRSEGKYGLATASGTVVKKAVFDKLSLSGGGKQTAGLPLIGKRKGDSYLVGDEGKEVSAEFDSLRYLGEGYYAGLKGGKAQILDRTGKSVLSDPGLIAPFNYSDGLLLVNLAGKPTYLNRNLKPAFALAFSEGAPFQNGTAIVWQGNKQVRINKQGKIIQVFP